MNWLYMILTGLVIYLLLRNATGRNEPYPPDSNDGGEWFEMELRRGGANDTYQWYMAPYVCREKEDRYGVRSVTRDRMDNGYSLGTGLFLINNHPRFAEWAAKREFKDAIKQYRAKRDDAGPKRFRWNGQRAVAVKDKEAP